VIATMIGTLVMARVAGNGDVSEEILNAGREAVLGRAASARRVATKTTPKKAVGRR
jgi:TetR/AcrR family transcriptional regulator, transcriptional repressor for nem operon